MLAAILSLGLFYNGCGDVFRPVQTPVFQPGGDPQRQSHALVVSSNGTNPGAAVIIDVSGDTNVATFSGLTHGMGQNPVYAINSGGINYVVDRDDDSVSSFILPTPGFSSDLSRNIITLPAGARPVFAAAAQGKVFVADSGTNGVAVISGNSFFPPEIPVGANPVALVATPDGTKLYCLNQGDNTVSVIFPAINQNVKTIQVGIGISPAWAAVSSDGSRVYVVNRGSSNISVIDTTSDSVIMASNLIPVVIPVGAGPNYIFYQASQNRFYVTSPPDNSLSIIDNNVDPGQCALTPSMCVQTRSLAGAPCNGQHATSVTGLADGTRAYVADDATNSVCVLNTTNNAFIKSILVGTAPVFIASDSDSTRVYTANSGSSDVSIIQTSTDTTVKRSDGITPLTISASGTPTFIALTP
ncbi:MAG TPA: YncE family protein [Terriglobales bacterium]|nr:YncE family protein [Terriglobales bacterium]